jgi:hypothetical protein
MDNSKALKEYVAFYGKYASASRIICDRCRKVSWSPEKLRLWMTPQHFVPGNGPDLCVDCARHFGLAW